MLCYYFNTKGTKSFVFEVHFIYFFYIYNIYIHLLKQIAQSIKLLNSFTVPTRDQEKILILYELYRLALLHVSSRQFLFNIQTTCVSSNLFFFFTYFD